MSSSADLFFFKPALYLFTIEAYCLMAEFDMRNLSLMNPLINRQPGDSEELGQLNYT